MGYVMMIVGIYLIVNGIGDYAGCVKGAVERMRDWGIVVHQTTLPSTLRVATSPYTGEALDTDCHVGLTPSSQ